MDIRQSHDALASPCLHQVYRDFDPLRRARGSPCADRAPARGEGLMTTGNPPREPALDRPDRVDAITAFLAPTIDDILTRIEGDEFTTTEFIALLQSDPVA